MYFPYCIFYYSGFLGLISAQFPCPLDARYSSSIEVPIIIPEFDWKNGNPYEVFYKTFVDRPHTVVLRGGYMAETDLTMGGESS